MGLQVIGLVSGGKDSFFSLLHCLVQGHRIVALANLHPEGSGKTEEESDLGSFMYQTVGHQVVPLYGEATGLPLYRQAIVGRAVQQGREYAAGATDQTNVPDELGETDETESMTALLQSVMAHHPEANAVCAGAILSTYQRTRVESVAVRLGLTSLAYLWQLPRLPSSSSNSEEWGSGYLADLGAASLDARIVKVASGGLDESILWADVASDRGRARLQRALERFGFLGGEDGAAMLLGEGGEYETLVVDGPRTLFGHGAIAVADGDCRVVHEGGGSAWLQIGKAVCVAKAEEDNNNNNNTEEKGGAVETTPRVRVPGMLDPQFESVLAIVGGRSPSELPGSTTTTRPAPSQATLTSISRYRPGRLVTWCVLPAPQRPFSSVTDATQSIVDQVRARLLLLPLPLSPTRAIVRTTVLLRRMADFAAVNAVYGTLFGSALPNPPARVAIACGDLLPDGVDIIIYATVFLPATSATSVASTTPELPADGDRQGLHVQSRSYWAPANIGPYSQAISVPVTDNSNSNGDSPRLVCIAGQIPLVPATMELPDVAVEAMTTAGEQLQLSLSVMLPLEVSTAPRPPASFGFQATLALQHLWRIGTAVGVQWWSSAVAYVPRQGSSSGGDSDDSENPSLAQKAILAAQAWRAAHEWRRRRRPEDAGRSNDEGDDEDEGDGSGPDLWDRQFDARYYRPGGDRSAGLSLPLPLPDWRVTGVTGAMAATLAETSTEASTETLSAVPPIFLAEVEALPRGAPVEWHAHAGFSQVAPGSVWQEEGSSSTAGGVEAMQYSMILKTDGGDKSDKSDWRGEVAQTVRMWPYHAVSSTAAAANGPQRLPEAVLLGGLVARKSGQSGAFDANEALPATATADAVYVDLSSCGLSAATWAQVPVVPCASLWSGDGQRLAAVVVQSSMLA